MERIYGIPINDKESLVKENISFKEIAEKSVELFLSKFLSIIFFMQICIREIYLFRNIMIPLDLYLLISWIMGSLSEFDKKNILLKTS